MLENVKWVLKKNECPNICTRGKENSTKKEVKVSIMENRETKPWFNLIVCSYILCKFEAKLCGFFTK